MGLTTALALGSLGATAAGISSSRKAAKAQERASGEAADIQREQLAQFEQLTEPFRLGGQAALDPLLQLLGLPSGIGQQIASRREQDQFDARLGDLNAQIEALGGTPTSGAQPQRDVSTLDLLLSGGKRPMARGSGENIPDHSGFSTINGQSVPVFRGENIPQQGTPIPQDSSGRLQQLIAERDSLLQNRPEAFKPTQAQPQEQIFQDPSISLDELRGIAERPSAVSIQDLLGIAQQAPSVSDEELGGLIRGETQATSPLLDRVKEETSRRLLASQAATGRLKSGGTAEALAGALAPLEIQEQQRRIANLSGLRQTGLQERQAQLSNLLGVRGQDIAQQQGLLGNLANLRQTEIEGQQRQLAERQQNIANLFNLLGVGLGAATGQGQAGLTAGANIGNLLQAQGAASAAGRLGQAQAIQGGISDLTGLALLNRGGFFGSPAVSSPTVSLPATAPSAQGLNLSEFIF